MLFTLQIQEKISTYAEGIIAPQKATATTLSSSAETLSSSPSSMTFSVSSERSTTAEVETSQPRRVHQSATMVTSSQSKLLTTFSTEITTVVNLATSYPLLSTTRNLADELPKDCSGINFDNTKNGSYIIHPYGIANTSVPVYCEFAEDGIWTVIQERIDGSVDFYRLDRI